MADVRIEIKTIVDKAISDLNKTASAVNGVDNSAKAASGGSDKLTAGLGKLASALSITALILKAGAALKKFGTDSLETASRAQELTAKFNTVFGASAPKATAALDDFGDTVHRSNLDLKEMAATTQNVMTAMGVGRAEAAEYAINLTKLAVDVAAFNNAQDVDVSEAFNSALTGNAIAAKRFGAIIRDSTMEAALFKMGIEGGMQAATEAQKVQARYNIIMTATKDAHGAAAKEADSYTNVTKGLAAAMTELEVAVGDNLIPTMTKFKKGLTDIIDGQTEYLTITNLLRQAQEYGIVVQQDSTIANSQMGFQNNLTIEQLQEIIYKYQEENGLLAENTQYVEELMVAEEDYANAMGEVAAAQRDLDAAQQGWLQSTANEVSSALKGLGLDTEDYMTALGVVDEVMGTTEKAEAEHKQAVDDMVTAYGKTGNLDDFKSALQGLKDAELPQTTAALETARSKAEELYSILDKINKMGKITVEVEYRQTGGKPDAGWASGVTNFKVPPGYPNDSFMAGLTSNEVVTVKSGGGDTSNSNAVSVYGDLVINNGGDMSAMDILADIRL